MYNQMGSRHWRLHAHTGKNFPCKVGMNDLKFSLKFSLPLFHGTFSLEGIIPDVGVCCYMLMHGAVYGPGNKRSDGYPK